MAQRKRRGFTIVELVIVIAVIAILAGVLIPTFISVINKANVSSDTSLVRNINTALAAEDVTGKPATMHEALKLAEANGYTIEKLTPRSTGDIVWDSASNRFALVDGDKTVYSYDGKAVAKNATVWKIAHETAEIDQTYSTYLAYNVTEALPAFVTGVDVGKNTEIAKVIYKGTVDAVIRTNSLATDVVVTAPTASVSHYGLGGVIDVQEVKLGACYNENGQVLTVKLTKGTLNVKSGANIGNVKVLATAAADVEVYNDNGSIGSVICSPDVLGDGNNNVKGSSTPVYEVGDVENAGVAGVSGQTYNSLADAIAAASAGDTVTLLKDSKIAEIEVKKSITIDGAGFTLVGSGYENYDNSSKRGHSGLVISSEGVTIKNLHLTDMGNYAAIEVYAANATIDNVTIDRMGRMGIDVDGRNNSVSATIKNCYLDLTFMGSGTGNGIQAQGTANITVENTTIENMLERVSDWASSGICFWDNSVGIVNNCTFNNCTNALAVDNCGAGDGVKLTISNTTVANCDMAVRADNFYDTNNFVLTLNDGNNFSVNEAIGRFFAYSDKTYGLSATVVINGGTYKANNGKNALFTFADGHDTWQGCLTGTITVKGGTTFGEVAKATANGEDIALPTGIVVTKK